MPKIQSLKNDLVERSVGIGFLQETWEQSENHVHQFEVEKLLEIDGSKYISAPRPKNWLGRSYGGVALVVNTRKYSCQKLNILVPSTLEVVWSLVKSKNQLAKFKNIIACSFYSPPSKKKNSKMADHIVSTLHMLLSKYPESAIFLGADKNDMDISPILKCGLKLRQVVDKSTRKGRILDVLIMNTSGLYKSPIIAPPIQADDPSTGQPSDHCVPVCIPHIDRYTPPRRNYRLIKYRPLPQSSIRRFGEWIVAQSWDTIRGDMSPTEQTIELERILNENLNKFCPVKEMKLGSQDKQFITAELKRMDRQKRREYVKRGKTDKYKSLKRQFDVKFREEAETYLNRNLENIRQSKPGQIFSVLKRLGAHPGEGTESNTFPLPEHENLNLSPDQSAERKAEQFASISQEYPPVDINPS